MALSEDYRVRCHLYLARLSLFSEINLLIYIGNVIYIVVLVTSRTVERHIPCLQYSNAIFEI